jgi:hypothetical protein
LSEKLFKDGPSERSAIAQRAEQSLVAAVAVMRHRLRLTRATPALVNDIKQTMDVKVPPHELTVLQVLWERERQSAFNQSAADEFPEIREEFERGIRDLMVAQKDRVSARQAHNTARNAWKEDPAADRRIREMEKLPPDQFHSPYRGQPEIYNRGVVLAFEKTIASAIGRSRISWTRGTNDNKSGGAILDVFVAAVQWATCVAWQCSAPPGAKPLKVRAEGLLRIVKGARRKK